MRRTRLFLLMFLLSGGIGYSLERPTSPPMLATSQLQNSIVALKLELNSHESELRKTEEKFYNLEAVVSGLRREIKVETGEVTERLRSLESVFERKIVDHEIVSKNLLADVKTIRDHLKETKLLFEQYKNQLIAVEKSIAIQNQNIENLQVALKAIIDFTTHDGDSSSASSPRVYIVKTGDSLEKIAQKFGISVKSIKDLNGLSSDRIRINQKLKLPGKL